MKAEKKGILSRGLTYNSEIPHKNLGRLMVPHIIYLCVVMCLCICVLMCAGAPGDQKRVMNLLELERQVIVSHKMWVLGTELVSLGRVASSLNH